MRPGPGLRLHLGAFYLFLYLPIAFLVVLSVRPADRLDRFLD